MITFENVSKFYNSTVGLENANIHIDKGDFVFLIGPTGAGKSTFIKLIMKEISADEGRIIVGGKDITRLSKREIPHLRRRIGIVFQDFRLLPKKTVYENVAFALEAVHRSKRIIKSRVPAVLEVVGIKDKAKKYPEELSAGEQQRVAIARAIINNPDLLIADEPTGNLDPVTAMGIMDLLQEINDTGTTVVMVTHAKDIVDRMHKRVVAIEKGHIVRDEYGEYGYEETARQEEEKPVFSEEEELKSGLVFDDDNPLTENGELPGEEPQALDNASKETEEGLAEKLGETEAEAEGLAETPKEEAGEAAEAETETAEITENPKEEAAEAAEAETEAAEITEKPEEVKGEAEVAAEKPEEVKGEAKAATEKPEEEVGEAEEAETEVAAEKPEEVKAEAEAATENPKEEAAEIAEISEQIEQADLADRVEDAQEDISIESFDDLESFDKDAKTTEAVEAVELAETVEAEKKPEEGK